MFHWFIQKHLSEKLDLNEKLAAVVDESKTNDDLMAKYARMAEEAIAGNCYLSSPFYDHCH